MQALISKKVKRIVSLLTPLFAHPDLPKASGPVSRQMCQGSRSQASELVLPEEAALCVLRPG